MKPLINRLRSALRSQVILHHVEAHVRLGWGSDFEQCPNIHCKEIAALLAEADSSAYAAKIGTKGGKAKSDKKTAANRENIRKRWEKSLPPKPAKPI